MTGTTAIPICKLGLGFVLKISSTIFAVLFSVGFLSAADPIGIELCVEDSHSEVGRPEGFSALARSFENPALIEVDVFRGAKTLASFGTVWGAANRAWCEITYIDNDSWFVVCEVFDRPFSSPSEFVRSLGTNQQLGTYFLSAGMNQCGPQLLDGGRPDETTLQIMIEVALWSEEERSGFFEGLRLSGPNGMPRIGDLLKGFWGFDGPQLLDPSTCIELEDEPKDLMSRLDKERQDGLGDWIDVLAISFP